MKIIKSKFKSRIIAIIFTLTILFSGYTWIFDEFFYELHKNAEKNDNLMRAYDPSLGNYTYIEDITQSVYEFNAKGECYILADLKGIDFTCFELDDIQYNLSYGINIFTKDFGNEFTAHTLEFQQSDINNDHFKWVCVEPLFIAMDNITVNLDQPEIIYFNAGGPISILMQPNFFYNWLYLEVDGVVINDIYPTDEYPEIDSVFYSYFIEDGAYIRFDLDTSPKEHVMKVKGNGTIEYKIIVNLDWDEDLIHDVEEVQKELFMEDLDPIRPNIWGFFEKSSKFSASSDTDEIRDGIFRFYVPETYDSLRYLYIALFGGTIFDIQIDEDKLTLKDVVLNKNMGSYAYKRPYGKVDSGYHTIYYKFYANEATKISFALDGREIIIFDKAEFKDTDGDGLKDIEERNSGLDPYSSDTDNDGLPDNLDSSPLYSLTLHKNNLHQFVIPHDPTRNTLISMSIKRPNIDYSTFATPRLYRGDLNVSIYFYMRLFGNQSITRTDLATFWKEGESNVDSFCLVDGYDCTGVGDALPVNDNPNAEFLFLSGKFSENTYEFDITFPKSNPAKDDNAIDLRFDFIWIVTSYDSELGNTTVIHIYEMEENLKLQSFGCREIGDINYKLASPDSMIENQILWALTQNPDLGNPSYYGVDDDIVGQGTVDFMSLPEKIEEDRENLPILREIFGEETTQIIKPDGDLLNNGWNVSPLWERIDEYPDDPDIYTISGTNGATCEFNVTSFEMEENKVVSKIKLFVRGKIEGFYALETYWRIGEGSLSSKQFPNLPVQEDPEYPVDHDWASVEWIDLSLPQSSLDNLRLRFVAKRYYGGGVVRVDMAYLEITYQDTGGFLENEVLYVAGLQKNIDVLNKINIQQNIIDPSFEVLHSGDYESYFSYYSVSNVYNSSEIQFLDDALRGEHKICYSITWNNYTEDGMEEYEKRAIIQGLPISMELISFSNSKILKITQAMGNEIPLDKIPNLIDSSLHDKIIFWNQTYIEQQILTEEIPLLNFNPQYNIYKEFFDTRSWEIESSKKFFNRYSDPIYTRFMSSLIDFYDTTYDIILLLDGSDQMAARIIDHLAYMTEIFFDIMDNPNILVQVKIDILDDFFYMLDDVIYEAEDWILDRITDNPPELQEFFELFDTLAKKRAHLEEVGADLFTMPITDDQADPLGCLQCWIFREQLKQKLKMGAIGGALVTLGTFLTIYASIELFQLYSKREDYAGRETEFVFRILAASCRLAIGVVIAIYGTIVLTQAIKKGVSSKIVSNVDELAEKSFTQFSKVLGKLITVIGILLDLFNFISNLAYAISIMDENPDLAIQILVQTLILDLGFGVAMGILSLALESSAAAAFIVMGALVIALIIFVMIFCFFVEPPPDEAIYPLNIELGMDYSKDEIKKQGGFEVGDEVSFNIGLENVGSIEDTMGWPRGIKAKFQLRLNYSASNVDEWSNETGRWDDRIEIEDSGYYYGENSYPAFWPSDSIYAVYVGGEPYLDTPSPWPSDKVYEYELYTLDRTLISASPELTLELKMTKDQYDFHELEYYSGCHYSRSAWVEGEIIRVKLGFPVLETSISAFYSHTTALPELTSFDTLETKLKIALAQYQYKDANEILSQIQQTDPDYECDIPINTNIATDLQENIIEINPYSGWVETDFSLILEGTEFPPVDIIVSPPEGFSIDHLSFTQPLTNSIVFNLSMNDPNELGGIYYFEMEIRRHDTGKLIYAERVPFRVPFVQDFKYIQSNILYHDSSIYNETLISEVLDPPLELLKGQMVNIKCKTTTSNEVLLEFLSCGNIIDTYTVIPRGNDDFGDQFIQIVIRNDITFDQFNFSVNLEAGQYFMVYDIVLMDSLVQTPNGEWFNPISITNEGNVIEFVEFSFSGILFDNVDTFLDSEEYYKQTQLIALMPGEHRDCMFNITNAIDPIDNLYWRGIRSYDPITKEIYLGYVDSLEIEGIHIQHPNNDTYNIYGKNVYFEQGIPLEIAAEDELLWSVYSLDGAPNVTFSERTYIPIPELDGTHTITVYGKNSLNEIVSSETRYFSIRHPIIILSPINKSITGPSLGYYPATYGFESGKTGTDFVDWVCDEAGGSISVLNELDVHHMVLQLEDTHSLEKVIFTNSFESNQVSGSIEFWIRTTDSLKQTIIRVQDGGYTNSIDFRILEGSFQYYNGVWNIVNVCNNNQWYHLRFEFDCNSDWHLWINGENQDGGIGYNYRGVPSSMNMIQFITHKASYNFKTFIDAIGYSWDTHYTTGDNLNEGILIDEITLITLNEVNYIIDDTENIYSPSSFVIPKLENGAHSLIFIGTDDYGYKWSSEKRWFTISEDIDPPEMTSIQVSDDPLEQGESQIVTTTIEDVSGLRSVSAFIQYPNGTTITELPMTNFGANKYRSTWNYGSSSLGVYYIDIYAVDASFNNNELYVDNAIVFDLDDTISPEIYEITVSYNPLDRFDIQTIRCNIEDLSGIQSTTAYIQYPDGTNVATVPMTNIEGSIYETQWDSSDAAYGTYFVDIQAIDSTPNQNLKYIDNGVTFSVREPPAPTINFIYPSPMTTVSGSIPIIVVANSKAGITKVQFKINNVLKHEDTNGDNGWSWTWNTQTVSNGGNTITCIAYDSLGRSVSDTISVTVQNSGGGDGGCPFLSVYNGEQYITEGLLDIHNPDGIDVIYYHTLITEPFAVNNQYLLRLTEHYKTISHIDKVRLFGRIANGRLILLPLLSATHSEHGRVTSLLWFSDDRWVTELGADHTNGISEYIDLKFLAFWHLTFTEFIFVIEGNNAFVK